MSLSNENGNGLVMPVTPMYGGGNGMGGFGFGGDGAWLILFILLACGGGWGNGFGGGFGGNAMGYDFPWLLNGQQQITNHTSEGFRDAMINDGINAIQTGVNGISTQLCNGFAGVEQGANTRQIANMQTAFAQQTAMNQGFSDVASQLANCCCENRLATCQTQNIVQNEGNQTRFADANNTRDIIQSQTQGTQAVLDKLCQLELDAKNDKISDLERQLTMANLAASQTAQTARLLADNAAQTTALEQYLNPAPIPAYAVQNPNCCAQNFGCGCGQF